MQISGSNVLFNFEPFSGYTYSSASNAANSAGSAAPPPTDTIAWVPNPSTNGFQCTLPFGDITGLSPASSIKDLLAGMSPNGDREGLGLYFEFSGVVTSTSAVVANSSPCTARDSSGACTARNKDIPYIAMVYRCSTCNIAACQATTTTISEAHVDLGCLPIDKCAPGQYTFLVSGVPDCARRRGYRCDRHHLPGHGRIKQ